MSETTTITADGRRGRTKMSTILQVGQRFRFAYAPDEEWEIAFPSTSTVETEDGDEVPVYTCRQLTGDQTKYARDRGADGMIDLCGDAILAALTEEPA